VEHSPLFFPPWLPTELRKAFPNPNAPTVDPAGRGVANAVVYVKGVNPEESRPWQHEPVTVFLRDYQLRVEQGDNTAATGFVRRGDRIEVVSRETRFHLARAGGAAFFTLSLLEPFKARSRTLTQKGVVELTEASGYYWLRAYLFVDDHPYYTRTDAEGNFTVKNVPPGHYQTVAWLPSWHIAGHERDAEARSICRLFYRPPVERTQPVQVPPHGDVTLEFTFREKLFR
jgi:hypothetical protein